MTCFPKKIVKAFADLPLVETRKITDDGADNNQCVLLAQGRHCAIEVIFR